MLADAPARDHNPPAALVTGGAGAIGKLVCEVLGRDGFLVAVADRDEVGARAVADACGGVPVAFDVSDASSVRTMIGRALDALGGRLDALAIAPAFDPATSGDDDVAAFDRVHTMHVLGAYLCMREATERMEPGARICTIATTGVAPEGSATAMAHHAAAGALRALTSAAAQALRGRGIAVNGVACSLENASAARPVAEAVAWLLSPRAATVSGTVLDVAE
jgi:NAD(P)-dependent dehydrogenase (short-subunit alcohol dehydrogenase family)